MKEAIETLKEGTNYPLISLIGLSRRFLYFLNRLWWIPVLAAALGLGAQFAYSYFRPPEARALARMLVGGKTKIPEGGLYTEEWQNFFGTQVELMQGEKIRRRALDRLQRLKQTQNASPVKIEVTQPRKTTIFVLEATGKDQTYTLNFLNAVMDEYLAYRKEVRTVSSDDTLASLTSQFLEQEKELKRQQQIMLEFNRTNNLALLEEESSSANLAKLDQELTDLRLQRALLPGSNEPSNPKHDDKTKSTEADQAALLLSLPAPDEKIEQSLEMLKMQKQQWEGVLRPEHPKIVKLNQDIAQAEALIALHKNGNGEQLNLARDSLDLKIKSVEAAVKQMEDQMVDANRRLAEFSLLKENEDRVQNLYDHLLHLVQNVGLDKNVDQETVVVMDQAAPAIAEKKLIQRALAGIIGSIVGLAIVGFTAAGDDRITSVAELKMHFPETLVGQIPDISSNGNGSLELLDSKDRRHVFIESYRAIRTSLMCMTAETGRPRAILITSAMPDEGKSTVSINLARSLAFAGWKVVLVDGDLRTGQLHEALGLPAEPGLNQLHGHNRELRDLPMATNVPNLSFIPRGAASLDCGELFMSPAIDRLLEELSSTFDYVLIDSAPVFAASDTLSLALKVDGAIFVLRDSFTSARLAREALGQLYQLEVSVLGLIFNRANNSNTHYPYFKNSEYYLPAQVG